MKTVVAFIAFFLVMGVSAQEKKPVIVKKGDLIEATYFHSNGKISQHGFFKNGKLTGKWTMYDNFGEKLAIGNYENGKRIGKWFFWEDGLLNEVDYANNQIVDHTTWNNEKAYVVNKN